MRTMFLVGAIVGATLAGFTARPKGQQVSVDDVLLRGGQYLVQYETGLATVLAEEQYSQWIENVSRQVVARRRLTSDFLFIRIKDPVRGAAWLGFRDVFIKDGAP